MAATRRLTAQEMAAATMRSRVEDLAQEGARMAGNAFAPVLFVQGVFGAPHEELLAGRVGTALRASLERLGYDPEDWCVISVLQDDGSPLRSDVLRLGVTTLDPNTVIAIDEKAAESLREAFAAEFAELPEINQALFVPGSLVRVRGMRMLNLGNFAEALNDDHEKQVAWARLKLVPKLGSPY